MLSTSPLSTPLSTTLSTPGQRIKSIRQHLALTRRLFEEKTGISQKTLEAWESDTLLLHPRKALLLAKALANLNVQVTDQYLLTGEGIPPLFPQEESFSFHAFNEEINFYREIEFFKKNHPSFLILKISDETMEPFFNKGDIVAGYATHHVSHFPLLAGRFCLLETTSREKILRKVLEVEGRAAKVSVLNPYALSTMPTMQKVNLRAIAQVTRQWHLKSLVELPQKSEDSL